MREDDQKVARVGSALGLMILGFLVVAGIAVAIVVAL